MAILVGAFTIFNALSITIAQRTRELGLLRMVGAGRRQVLGSVLLEALTIGVLASAVGLVAGLGIAKGLNALFVSLGLDLPEAGTVFASRTIVVSLLVGTLVTLIAGLLPAWRATRVAPVEALRDADHGSQKLHLPGRVVRFMAGLLGRPAQAVGASAGMLARRNAMRHPGRTLGTAAALMIGVMLVTLVSVVAAGLRDTTSGSLERRITADYVLTGSDGWSPTEAQIAKSVGTAPGVQAISSLRQDRALALGGKENVNAIDPATVGRVFSFDITQGRDDAATSLPRDGAIVDEGWAKEHTSASAIGSRSARSRARPWRCTSWRSRTRRSSTRSGSARSRSRGRRSTPPSRPIATT